jgi:hypothetical protein
MAGTGTLTLSGLITGEAEGSSLINLSWTVPGTALTNVTVIQWASYGLASGNNTFIFPDETTLALLIPPSDNTFALVLKGVAGDTGIALGRTTATVISRSGLGVANSFVVNAAGDIPGFRVVFV